MDMPTGLLLIQTGVLALLAVDRWVHAVSGPMPLSAKLDSLAADVDRLQKAASERHGEITTKVGALQVDMSAVKTDIAAVKVNVEDHRARILAFEGRRSST